MIHAGILYPETSLWKDMVQLAGIIMWILRLHFVPAQDDDQWSPGSLLRSKAQLPIGPRSPVFRLKHFLL